MKIIDLRSRNWRVELKAAIDALNTDPVKPSIHDTLRKLK